MLTYSGRLVMPDNLEAPTLSDMCLGLSRMPRFAGQTKVWWTVAHHLVVCERILREGGYTLTEEEKAPVVALHVLLHDAHESIVCDIPATWKTPEISRTTKKLDNRIYDSLGLGLPGWDTIDLVKDIDYRALVAEAYVVGPPRWSELKNYGAPTPADVQIVRNVRDFFSRSEDIQSEYWRLMNLYLNAVHGGSYAVEAAQA